MYKMTITLDQAATFSGLFEFRHHYLSILILVLVKSGPKPLSVAVLQDLKSLFSLVAKKIMNAEQCALFMYLGLCTSRR